MDAVLSDPVIQGLLGSGMLCKDELSPFLIFQSLSLHRCMAWKAIGPRDGGSDSDPDCRWGIRKRSHLGQMPYESEACKLKLEAIWGTTALQELDVEQNVRSATTDGAVRL